MDQQLRHVLCISVSQTVVKDQVYCYFSQFFFNKIQLKEIPKD